MAVPIIPIAIAAAAAGGGYLLYKANRKPIKYQDTRPDLTDIGWKPSQAAIRQIETDTRPDLTNMGWNQTGRIVLGNISAADVRQAKRAATVAKNEAAQARSEAREAASQAREERSAVREQKSRGKRISYQVEEELAHQEVDQVRRGEDYSPQDLDLEVEENQTEDGTGRIFLGAIKKRIKR